MAFSLRIGPMLVTADTAAEAAELVRALGGVPANEATAPPEPLGPPSAVEAPTTEAASATSDKPQRKWPIGRGGVFKQGPDRFVLEISIDGRADRRGSFKTREAAEIAREDTYQSRLRGDPLPIYVWRRCHRCGVVGHTAAKCKAPVAVEQLDEPGRDRLPPAAALPAPTIAAPAPALQKGTPEWRKRVAEAVRASWARRRAAVAGQTAPVPGASDCSASDEDEKQEVLAEPQDADGLARLLLAKGERVESLDHLLDEPGDDSTDLTDLVDVPDAEPTAIPDVNLGIECHACGQRGHIMSSPDCPLTTKPGWSAERGRTAAEPRSKMPPSFTETPLTMRRHLHVIDPGAEPVDEQRPRTRGECQGEPRPCPFVSCRYHMAIDVLETGNLHRTFGDLDLAEMPETCALDVADRDGATLEEIGRALNVSRERIRQIETLAIKSAKRNAKRLGLRFEAPDDRRTNAPEDAL